MSKMSVVSEDEKKEVKENLEDCNANVLGLTEELDRLKGNNVMDLEGNNIVDLTEALNS